MTNSNPTKAKNSTFIISILMRNLRGHIRLDPLADTHALTDRLPVGAKPLGSVTCGTSAPGVLALLPQPTTDYDNTPYPFTLVHVSQGRWTRLPMRRTLAALSKLGYSIHAGDFVRTELNT